MRISARTTYVRTFIAIPKLVYDGHDGNNASTNVLHWNGFGAEQTKPTANQVYIDGVLTTVDNDWYWGKSAEAGYWPGNGGDWNSFETVIDGIDYAIYAVTHKSALKAGATTAHNLSGLYLDSKVDYNNETGEYTYDGKVITLGNAPFDGTLEVLVATEAVQYSAEWDAWTALNTAFGAPSATAHPWIDYQLPAVVDNAEDLTAALAETDANVFLANDVATDDAIVMTNGGSFDGNGNTINASTSVDSGVNPVLSTNGGSITNVKVISETGVESAGVPRALYMPSVKGDLYVSDSWFEAHYAMNINATSTEYGLYADNCTFVGWSSYSSIKEAVFTDCTFDGTFDSPYYAPSGYSMARVRPYADSTFDGCTFKGDVVMDYTGKTPSTLTFINCLVDDADGNLVSLTAENIKTLLASEEGHGLDSCTVTVDGVAVNWN